MSDIKTLLDGELAAEIENLSVMENGSEEKATAVKQIDTLYRLKLEESKNDREYTEKKKSRWFQAGTSIVSAIVGALAYDKWFKDGLEFEKEGTVTSTFLKSLTSRMSSFIKK